MLPQTTANGATYPLHVDRQLLTAIAGLAQHRGITVDTLITTMLKAELRRVWNNGRDERSNIQPLKLARSVRPLKAAPKATCAVDGCGNKVHARGWCGKHYGRWLKYGDPEATVEQTRYYYGVEESGKKWRVSIGKNGKHTTVGYYDDLETAARAYDKAARAAMDAGGKIRPLNFPDEAPQ